MLLSLLSSGNYRRGWFDPHRRDSFPPDSDASRLIVLLFLLSLAVAFVPLLVVFLIFRSQSPTWPPPDLPAIPRLLWLSTAVLLATSAVLQAALRAARCGGQGTLVRALGTANVLALVFLACQLTSGLTYYEQFIPDSAYRYAAGFFFFAALHGLHVLAGLVPLAWVTRRALRGDYSAYFHPGVRYVTYYWHMLDGVWLVLFATIVIPGG